ncbi:MAG: response regulator [Candidatus Doudnabacteria bacterium]|nr:response regulator [Candidatus Doudnabacteria bacterium]
MKVLLIDDDEFIIDLYEHVFKVEKHETVKAYDGIEALNTLKKMDKLPDVIILDIVMPKMDGFEFLGKIKADNKLQNIPVVVLSNLYSREDREKGLSAGADVFLVKSEHDPNEILTYALSFSKG